MELRMQSTKLKLAYDEGSRPPAAGGGAGGGPAAVVHRLDGGRTIILDHAGATVGHYF
jgi:hypothetical protein